MRAIRMVLLTFVVPVVLSMPNASLAQTGMFTASGKVVSVLAETRVRPGDKPNHELVMTRRMDTITYSDSTFTSGQALLAEVADAMIGTGGSIRGYFAITHPSGDKTFTSYEGTYTATPKPTGPPELRGQGKWSYTGGTGKFDGIVGGGTFKFGPDLPGGAAYEFDGQYTLKQ